MTGQDPWSPGLTARGSLYWSGTATGPAELAAAVGRLTAEWNTSPDTDPAGTSGRWVDTTGLAVPDLVTTLFAAAAARLPVRVAGPVPAPAAEPPPAGPPPADAFLVVSTSGSTATPRAIARTLASWTASFDAYTDLVGLGPADRLLLTGPPTSTLQLFAAVHAIAIGAEVTDDPDRATAAVCVPTVLPGLVGLPRLRSVVVAGAKLPDDLAAQAVSSGLRVAEYYGAAELSFVAARRLPAAATTATAVRAVPLRAFPGVQVEVRDGVLWSRSAFQALGYLGAPGALRTDAAGFATVGDLAVGRLAPDGMADELADGMAGVDPTAGDPTAGDVTGITVLGRGDTAVAVGGRTVLIEDVEATLAGIPGVTDGAVAGIPHPRFGQQLVAVVALAPGIDLPAVRAAARARLGGENLPRRWLRVGQVPRTPGGKIDRRALARICAD